MTCIYRFDRMKKKKFPQKKAGDETMKIPFSDGKPLEKSNRLCVSQKGLARALIILFCLMLVPLVLIALYNYPADDDFPYTYAASLAWLETGSLWAAARAIVEKMVSYYQNHFGLFMHPLYNATNTLIFGVQYYFLNNWYVLALICLSVGYFLKGVVCRLLRAGKSTFWIVYVAVMVLVLQFMPCIGEGVYWHAGSNHTFSAMMLLLLLGLLIRTHFEQSRPRAIWRMACMVVCCACVGAVEYSTMLGGAVLLVLLTLWSHGLKSKSRPYFVFSLCVLAVVIVIFALSPGNAKRQAVVGDPLPPVQAVVTSVLDSFDLAGQWLSPHLFAMLMLIVPVMWKPLRESPFRFAHPLLAFITSYGLFSAALVPGVYSNYGYGAGRYMNVLFFYFLVMAIGSVLYLEGSLIRYLQQHETEETASLLKALAHLGERFTALHLALCVFFLMLGGFSTTIMNKSSLSAIQSLVTGEAAQFRAEMAEREEYIRVTDSDVVDVRPLSVRPYVFKDDKLPWQGIYGTVRYMKWYFEAHYEGEP